MRDEKNIIRYNDVDFKWISNHYDMHLNGTCIFNMELCEFKTGIGDDEMVEIIKLGFGQKLWWRYRQWKFEKCVGYHWTIGSKNKNFYYRKPVWFYKFLFKIYYKHLI